MNTFIRSAVIAVSAFWAVSAHGAASRVGNAYYEDIPNVSAFCDNTSCSTTSSAASPEGVYLRIQHVYCLISVVSPSVMTSLVLEIWTAPPASSGASKIKEVGLGFPQPTSGIYSFDHDILLVTGSGRYVVFRSSLSASASSSIRCGFTGDLLTPPPAQ